MRAVWRMVLGIVALVSIMSRSTNIEALELGKPLLIEVAKIAVPRKIESYILETPMNNNKCISLSCRISNKIIFRLSIQCIRWSEPNGGWIYYASSIPVFEVSAFSHVLRDSWDIGCRFCGSYDKRVKEEYESDRWLPPAIL